MNRKELYAKIKELNLQNEVKKTFGDNYTRVGNVELINIITKHIVAPKVESEVKGKSGVVGMVAISKSCKCDRLIEVLKKKHILLDSEVSYINS